MQQVETFPPSHTRPEIRVGKHSAAVTLSMMSAQGDLRQTLLQRAQELFALCDREGKGYAFREELGVLGNELPLSPEQLEVVFDSLDVDGDGKLTIEEFSDGFGMFMGIDSHPRNYENDINGDEEDDEDEVLEDLLDHLGARNLFNDEDYVKEMWHRVRKDDPVMRSNFENFISKMACDLKYTAQENETLQSTLKSREQENETRVQSLYLEMEEQMKRDKEEALAREHRNEQRLRDELETELQEKDQQLQDLLEKHAQMEKQLEELNSEEAETKYENQKLQKDRDTLEYRLVSSEKMLEDMKKHLDSLRKKSLDEKRKRAQAALKVSEGIALERENLVLELQTLKEINKQLLDENDELIQTAAQLVPLQQSIKKMELNEENHVENGVEETMATINPDSVIIGSTINPGSVIIEKQSQSHPITLDRMLAEAHPLESIPIDHNSIEYSDTESRLVFGYEEDDEEEVAIQNNLNLPTEKTRSSPKQNIESSVQTYTLGETIPEKPKKKIKEITYDEYSTPSRVFKVVFLGDSGVGKTSILQRFCTNDFKYMFNATIGVDFQMKTVLIDGERIALQLWDTAGQERFRSLTQQYFRKADGIIVVYDVTSERSFKSIRNWMHCVQEGAQDTVVVLLLGNKTDMCESDDGRVVKIKDGERIADEYGTLFYETSAKTGDSIKESIEALASLLKTKEDEAIEQVLRLQEEIKKKKKKCC